MGGEIKRYLLFRGLSFGVRFVQGLGTLVFRLKHFLTDYVCGVCCCTCCTVIVVSVAWNIQFRFLPNNFLFRWLWRRSLVLWLGPVRVVPIVVRLVLCVIVILLARIGSLTLWRGWLKLSLWGSAIVETELVIATAVVVDLNVYLIVVGWLTVAQVYPRGCLTPLSYSRL